MPFTDGPWDMCVVDVPVPETTSTILTLTSEDDQS
jgi:hypothetical protein